MIQAPRRLLASNILLPVLVLVACENSHADPQSASQAMRPVEVKQATPPSPAAPAPRPLSDSDRFQLALAQNACAKRDYRAFFDTLAKSNAVRLKYSAHTIQYATLGFHGENISLEDIDRFKYHEFPVQTEDYTHRPTSSAKDVDEDDYLYLEFNQSQNNEISVDWTHIHYVGEPQGEEPGSPVDASGNLIEPGTPPQPDGQLLFRPTAECWEFFADIRWDRRKGPRA